MAIHRETSTDKELINTMSEFGEGIEKKPNWVNLAQLDGPLDDSLANQMLYKPALRFHGLTGGIWGQGLSEIQAIPSDPPPSYRFAESVTSRQPGGDACSNCDVDTTYNTLNIATQSPLTLRRRNTVAVILVAIGLLAAVAAVTGVILHFLQPKAMLRANVRFTIANRNYTGEMRNKSSLDFHEIARPLCQEMDVYFLTSELADFYLGCEVASMRRDTFIAKNGTEVHFTLDFIENQVSNNAERIKNIIMRKSGRHKTEDTLYLTIRDFMVYLRSLRVDVEILSLPDDHPGRRHRPRIPWDEDIDFIARKSNDANNNSVPERVNGSMSVGVKELTNNLTETLKQVTDSVFFEIPRDILPGGEMNVLPIITPALFSLNADTLHQHANALYLSSTVADELAAPPHHVFRNVSMSASVNVFNNNKQSVVVASGAYINPSKASVFSSLPLFMNITDDANLPLAQEVHVRNDVRIKKISIDKETPINYKDKRNLINQLDTSFHDINDNSNDNAYINRQGTQAQNEKTTTGDVSQKIFTIFNDVFLIVGTNQEGRPIDEKQLFSSQVRGSVIVSSLNGYFPNDLRSNNKPVIAEYLNDGFIKPTLYSIISTPAVLSNVKQTETPFISIIPQPVFNLNATNVVRSEASISKPKESSISIAVEMNEMVVDPPLQEAVPSSETNIEWINIFNVPRKTVDIHVGEVTSEKQITPGNYPTSQKDIAVNQHINIGIERKIIPDIGITKQVNIRPALEERKGINDINLADQSPRVEIRHRSAKLNDDSGIQRPYNNNVTVVVRNRLNKISADGYYGPFVNGIGMREPLSNARVTLDRPRDLSSRSNSTNGVPNPLTPTSKTIVVINRDKQRNQQMAGFFPDIMDTNNMLLQTVVSSSNQAESQGRSFQTKNQQPWIFLKQMGLDVGLYERNSIRSRQLMRTNSVNRVIDQSWKRSRKWIIQNNNLMWTKPVTTEIKFSNANIFGKQIPMSIKHGRSNSVTKMSPYPGLPKSRDFSDIADMKEILRQLVDNMYNMTAKIDHMQDAIDFINKTFHETHKPLFNLEETLGNMTISLANLNQNLNTINTTMKSFKDFLKQFGNTIFNIDDVIRHIDDTINNLGNAVSYIENSMNDLNGTVNGIAENVIDIDGTLTHVNRSVIDVSSTASYSNRTLDSMRDTLISLENAVSGLTFKVTVLTKDADILDISLNNINETVRNTHQKLNTLNVKMQSLNSSMIRVGNQIERLNKTYTKINKTLQNMNEPYIFVNGTVLEVIEKLASTADQLVVLQNTRGIVNNNITSMNSSLAESMEWLNTMVETLMEFNLWTGSNNDTITISLRNIDMIETVGMLLNMNGTLSDIGNKVDDINDRLVLVDVKLKDLEEQLAQLDKTLDNVDAKFKLLGKTLNTINSTIGDTNLSLNEINTTVSAMGPTFDKIDVSFGNINETLNNVEKTLAMINTTKTDITNTLNSVNRTFPGLANTVDKTTDAAEKLALTVSNFSGSIQELNSQLYNANESMRITKSKADIAEESYRLLNKTLLSVNETVSELQSKLLETNQALHHTNTSFAHVNDSLNGMETSFKTLQMELAEVQDSFVHMKSSMHGFGSAFPNIQTSIKDSQNRMSELQLKIGEIDAELQTHKTARDGLVLRHNSLKQKLDLLSNEIDVTHVSALDMINISNLMRSSIVLLNESVKEAINKYTIAEKNIKYINKTHEELQQKYFGLFDRAHVVNSSFFNIVGDMELLRKDFDDLAMVLKKYTNIDIAIGTIIDKFDAEVVRYSDSDGFFKNQTIHFNSLNQLLWNENGDPVNVYTSFDELYNATTMMNNSLVIYTDVLDKIDNAIESGDAFNKNMQSKLQETYSLREIVDEIESNEDVLNKKIVDMAKVLQIKHEKLFHQKETLNKTLDHIKYLWETFGDVNGTFEYSEIIHKIDNDIRRAQHKNQKAEKVLNTAANNFKDIVDRYKFTNASYHSKNFGLSSDDKDILDKTLSAMKETEQELDGIETDVVIISNSFDDIDFEISDVSTIMDNLETTLLKQSKKNNYVMSMHPKLENRFNTSLQKHSIATNNKNSLVQLLKELQDKANLIDAKLIATPNINVSIVPEKEAVKQFLNDVRDLDDKLTNEKPYIDKLYMEFGQFEESKNTLTSIEEKYNEYNDAVESFENTLQNVSSKYSKMYVDANNISDTLDYLLKQIVDYAALESNMTNTDYSLKLLHSKFNSTSSSVGDASERLFLLKVEFEDIKLNYTAFTATDLDLSDSYVNEAIKDIEGNLYNITTKLQDANVSIVKLIDFFEDTKGYYSEHNYDRTNIEPTIRNLLLPNMKQIADQTTVNNQDLDEIISKIPNIELALKGINETIHSTNKQLSKDLQKKLLADTKFNDLVSATGGANKSLSTTSDLLKESRNNLDDTMSTLQTLKDRLENYPSVQVSLDEYFTKLQEFYSTIDTLFSRVKGGINLLNEINNTIWVGDDERYSSNETIRDIKSRYKNAEDMLDDIFNDIASVNSIIESVINGTNQAANKVAALDDSLNEFDRSDNELKSLFQDFYSLENEVNKTDTRISGLEKDFSVIHEIFENIKRKYSHIDKNVYNQQVFPFNEDSVHVNDILNNLNNATDVTVSYLEEVRNLSRILKKADKKSYNSKGSLDNFIKLKNTISDNISQILERVNVNLNIIESNASFVDPNIKRLDDRLRKMENDFKKQEKIEYFDKHFPRKRYDSLSDTISNVQRNTTALNSNIKEVTEKFKQLLQSLGKFKNIRFDTKHIEVQLAETADYADQNIISLQNISEEYRQIEPFLYSPDGLLLSDNETIEDMKKRFDLIDKSIERMNESLHEMMLNIAPKHILIDYNNATVDGMQTLLVSFKNIGKRIDAKHTNGKQLNASVSTFNNLNQERVKLFNEEKIAYKYIIDKFNETTNDQIEHLKKKINNSIVLLEETMNQFEKMIGHMISNCSQFETILQNYSSSFLADHFQSESLQRLLSDFKFINTILNDLYDYTDKNLSTFKINASVVDEELTNLKHDIAKLQQHLIRQEKQDYIIKNRPFMFDVLQVLQDRIEQASGGRKEMKNRWRTVKGAYRSVKNDTETEQVIDISLIEINNSLQNVKNTIPRLENILNRGNNTLNNMYTDILNLSVKYWKDNDTLDDIKEAFEKFNHTFKNVSRDVGYVDRKVEEYLNKLDGHNIFLTKVINETKSFQHLNQNHLNDKENLENIRSDLTTINIGDGILSKTIKDLMEDLNDISKKYGSVSEPSLHHKLKLLLQEMVYLNQTHTDHSTFVTQEEKTYNATNTKSDQLESILSNVSKTLEDLITKNSIAVPLSGKISDNVLHLNNSIANVSKSEESIRAFVLKLNESIVELKEDFRRQQIYEYIKDNFPNLLAEYQNVNDTLSYFIVRIPQAISKLETLKSNNDAFVDTLVNLVQVNILYNDKTFEYNRLNETLADLNTKGTMLEERFHDFEDVITGSFASNETLNNIKKQFAAYQAQLHGMVEELKYLHETLNQTDFETSKAINITQQDSESLQKFKLVLRRSEEEENILNDLDTLLNHTRSTLQETSSSVKYQNGRIETLDVRFTHVESVKLKENKTKIKRKLNSTMHNISKSLQMFEGLDSMFELMSNDFDSVHVLLANNITTFDNLINVTGTINALLDNLVQETQNVNDSIEKHFQSDIITYNPRISAVEIEIDNLELMYQEKEKQDYISANIPDLKLMYRNIKEGLDKTKQRLPVLQNVNIKLGKSIDQLQHRYNKLSNIEILTEGAVNRSRLFSANITSETHRLNSISDLLAGLDLWIFHKTNWSDFSIEDVKQLFTDFRNDTASINKTLSKINERLDELNQSVYTQIQETDHDNAVLDRYIDSLNSSIGNENDLQQLSNSLDETHIILEDVKDRFYHDGDRLHNLSTKQYTNVSNSGIKYLVNQTKNILEGKVGLRIPLINRLFAGRLLTKYNVVTDRFSEAKRTLNATYKTTKELESVLRDVEDTLNNVTLETEYMINSEEYYRKDAEPLSELLNESSSLLDKLEEMYKAQTKLDLLNSVLPGLKADRTSQKAKLERTLENVNASLMQKNKIMSNLELVISTLGNITTVNISTKRINSSLTDIREKLTNIGNVSISIHHDLNNIFNPDINASNLASNTSVSLKNVKDRLKSIEKSLKVSEANVQQVTNSSKAIQQMISIIDKDVTFLNNTLSKFIQTENNVKELDEMLKGTTARSLDTVMKLESARSEIAKYSATLNYLRKKYEQFIYDDAGIELTLRELNSVVETLNDTLSNASLLLTDAKLEFNATSDNLYKETDSVESLNNTLVGIGVTLPISNFKVYQVNKVLDDIIRSIPELNIDISDMKEMLKHMNDTLVNEDKKSSFAENALPILEEKYKITNKTFEITNKTLERMAEELQLLNNYIDSLKGRMTDFSTINISMSDIDANITHLENRLVIMKDHFDNVKDIMNNFQRDLRINNIFGRNISLADVEDQYKSFNDTLDLMNGVLLGIDNEAYEMDEHFDTLNNTMYNIDRALDIFEEKQINTKIMENEIKLVGLDIIETNKSVRGMHNTVNQLSKTFDNMQMLYADVFDSTTENNTVIKDLLTDMNNSLTGIREVMSHFDDLQIKNTVEFTDMNETLFASINTYEDLNNTLDHVKNKLLILSKSLNKLQRGVEDVKRDTLEKNDMLSNIDTLLDSLNKTLYIEQTKFDFIQNNLGSLEDKFSALKSPVELAKQTVSKANENLHNTNIFVNNVAKKLDSFSNVHISLDNDINIFKELNTSTSNIETRLRDINGTYTELKQNFTKLDDRAGDMGDIVGKYNGINQTLDNLQDSLTDVLAALDEVNIGATDITSRTENLDLSLDKLDNLNTSSLLLQTNFDELERKILDTNKTLTDSALSVDRLQQTLTDMESLYKDMNDTSLLDTLYLLLEETNKTSKQVADVQSMHTDLEKKETLAVAQLSKIHAHLNGDISNLTSLDVLNAKSEASIIRLENQRDQIIADHNATDVKANSLQNIIESLTNEISILNDTLWEEKKKREFIAKNFPDMEHRYNVLKSDLDKSNVDIQKANTQVDDVARHLIQVQDRLDNLTAIAIPLDSENDEVVRLKKHIKKMKQDFKNVSAQYNGLQFEGLKNLSIGFNNLKDAYGVFDQSMTSIVDTLKNINTSLIDANDTLSVIKHSVSDINATVDEFVETGEKIAHVLQTGDEVSANIQNTNGTIEKLSKEVNNLAESLENLLSNYSHIQDPDILQTKDIIKNMLNSTKYKVKNLSKNITEIDIQNKDTYPMFEQMNKTYTSTKSLIEELKNHIRTANNLSNVATENLSDTEAKRRSINQSADAVTPELRVLFDKIGELGSKYIKEQNKLNLINTNKPIIESRLKDLQKPLEETNRHISLVEVKLVDLKYSVVTVGSRLDKFKTLNITTDRELEQWNDFNENVENISNTFEIINKQYKQLLGLVNTINERNMTIEEMKKKFSELNDTIGDLEKELNNLKTKLTNIEAKDNAVEKILNGLKKSMDNFRHLQTDVDKTTQNIDSLQSSFLNLNTKVGDIINTRTDIQNKIESMKNTYEILNNSNWEKLLPKMISDLAVQEKILKDANNSIQKQEERLNKSIEGFEVINVGIEKTYLTRINIDPKIAAWRANLNTTSGELSSINTPLDTAAKQLQKIKLAMNTSLENVNKINSTLYKELMKHNYVNETLPILKEKHIAVNKSYSENLSTMDIMQGQVSNLVSIIEKIKNKMSDFGLEDTDNSIKKLDVAIQKLNATVVAIVKKNEAAGRTLSELKSKLWSKDTMYKSTETLVALKTRFEKYNKTLDEINTASHTINVKLADLDMAASSVIGQLMERDAILTTTPATTTPSGPPEWLSFYSTNSGQIGVDPGMAECAVEDMTEWNMMKITRVNKDGREEAIGAWKLDAGARKAVRDRRIRVRRTKTATGGKLTVGIKSLQCEDEGTYYCSIDSYSMWPLETKIGVTSPPEDNLKPDFPTEVFEDKVANFSCTGHPGYPNGRILWRIKREKETAFRPFDFYSSKASVTDTSCVRTETNKVEYQFDLQWNNTKVQCYIENTDYYAEGVIRLLPYDICNKVRYLGTISHPYTPHKYIVCGKELNIMQCPGNTCYDDTEENCVRCKAGHAGGGDPCLGQPLFSYVAHETDCKKYYICMGPTKTTKKCTKGYFAPNIPGNCVMSYAQSHCGRKAG